MKIGISAMALIAGLSLSAAAFAQDPPSGGPDAKGNAPLKHAHTVNDGTAKRGANSFTQNEAKSHILHSGYTDVSTLTKGGDGVWRGTATKDGANRNVALDFKGNVSDGGPTAAQADQTTKAAMGPRSATVTTTTAASTSSTDAQPAPASTLPMHRTGHRGKRFRHHRHHHTVAARCAHPGPNGVACSGRDRNMNGISDKEDHAINKGAHP